MADTIGLVTEYIRRIGSSRRNETNPVDPKGNPISDVMRESNQYGPAIPVMALQQFVPGTPNEKTLQEGRGSVYYGAKVYEDVPQSIIQTLKHLTDEVSHINKKANHMIRLRGEKAYEIVSGQDPDGSAAINDLRRNDMIRRDNASSLNGWIGLSLAILVSFWVFTSVYLVINGGTGSMIQNAVQYMNLAILPAMMAILIVYGYMFIPGYGITLPAPGPSMNQFS